MVELFYKLKLTLISIKQDILSDAVYLFSFSMIMFFSSIIIFAGIYYFLFKLHEISIVQFHKRNLIGFATPLPAFHISETLKTRIEVEAKNDLRITDFSNNIFWQSFSEDRSLQRSFPDSANHWDNFREDFRLGVTPIELVEKNFQKHWPIQITIQDYRDNSFDIIFPIRVLQEYFEIVSVEDLQRRIQLNQLSFEEASTYNALLQIAPKIRINIFEIRTPFSIGELSNKMKQFADEILPLSPKHERMKSIIYGEILNILAPSQTILSFNFAPLTLRPEKMDFVYMSTMIATGNVPSEVTPLTNDSRAWIWLQSIFSYFNLAVIVAALLKLFKI